MNSGRSRPRLFFRRNVTKRQFLTTGVLGIALAAATIAAVGAVQSGAGSGGQQVPPATVIPVETVTATPVTSFQQRRTFTGLLKASRSSELGFERTGRLIAVAVEEGDRVDAGDVLARLDTQNLQARQRELQAQRAAALALLAEFEAGPRRQTIEAARAEVRDLQAQVELAKLNFSRREELLHSRAISQEEYDQTELGMRSTQARLDVARQQLSELEAGTRSEQIAAQRAITERLEAALEDVAVDLAESELVAPFAGIIARRHMDEGTIVAPGAPLVRLVEDQQLEAWIGLPVQLAARLEAGAAVDLLIEQRSRRATLKAVLPELDPATRTRTAIFVLESPGDAVPSQVVRVEFTEAATVDGFWIPTTALTRGSRGLWSILVVEEETTGVPRAAKREVEVLHTDGDRVLVRGTLTKGEQVIAGGTHRIVAGQQVNASSPFGRNPAALHKEAAQRGRTES